MTGLEPVRTPTTRSAWRRLRRAADALEHDLLYLPARSPGAYHRARSSGRARGNLCPNRRLQLEQAMLLEDEPTDEARRWRERVARQLAERSGATMQHWQRTRRPADE